MIREAIFAGKFYPLDAEELSDQIKDMVFEVKHEIDAKGIMVPHAGYVFSGKTAGKVFSAIKPKERIILLGPNHTGAGGKIAVSKDVWRTPIGDAEPDIEFIDRFSDATDMVSVDADAHRREHSLEVQMPFIKYLFPEAKIIPVAISSIGPEELMPLAETLVDLIGDDAGNTLILASSDMTHYEARESAKQKDIFVLKKFKELDAEAVIEAVQKQKVSMCGYFPAALMLACCKLLGAQNAQILEYTDSGYVTGDVEQVVAYAGVVIT